MNKEEKQPNVYMIPKNSFDTGYVFGGSFKTKNFIEGVVVAIPFLGIFIYGWTQLGWDVESTVAYAAIVCAGVFVAVSHGVGDAEQLAEHGRGCQSRGRDRNGTLRLLPVQAFAAGA